MAGPDRLTPNPTPRAPRLLSRLPAPVRKPRFEAAVRKVRYASSYVALWHSLFSRIAPSSIAGLVGAYAHFSLSGLLDDDSAP